MADNNSNIPEVLDKDTLKDMFDRSQKHGRDDKINFSPGIS